ncbi:putative phage-related protein [Vibrio phage VP882]|jgi:lambda family phage portal protein|uniref:Putative phage-related protein n=1 Tax=Vibrio phage VP882 TaxID=2913982 RepID=Q6R4V2_9CAUD|nr:phage portal protein [Vibrio parahaemolyticus]YP_001039817.1 portal protein [Vibrio phage VP882]AAS38504.2 putative phage-related protein [Vibrio phage VP882]TOE71998.1 phage portal protein [Vibrio parahaemolyticus]HCG9011209.1 phage portal protein [Vibrio parahaemolyticus]
MKRAEKKPSLAQRMVNWAWYRYVEPQKNAARAFEAARRDRLGKAWLRRASRLSADEEIYADLASLVQRAREQSINNPYAKRFYQLLKNNVIGPKGMTFQSRVKRRNGKPDDRANTLIEGNWQQWIKKGNCDVTGRYHFVTLLHLWMETLARDGEVLVREHRGYPNKWGYALQILECDRLDLNYNADLQNGNRIRMSIELDAWERPVAYHLLVNHPGDNSYCYHYAGQTYERVPADEIIHTFVPWRPHQNRGIPWTHASMVELHHIGEYRKSEMIAAELGAKKVGFYEQDPEAYDQPPEDDQGEIVEEVEAGTYQLLPYGIRFKEHKIDHPHTNFGAFVKSSLRGVAAGMGPAYNRLAHDLEGVNFSSLRSGELDERDLYKLLQFFVVTELLERVAGNLISMSLLTQALPLNMVDIDRLSQYAFQPRGWDWVDPAKDSKAHSESIKNRTRSRSSIIRAAGDDPEDVFDEIAWEEQLMRDKGVNPTPPEQESKDATTDEEDDSASDD